MSNSTIGMIVLAVIAVFGAVSFHNDFLRNKPQEEKTPKPSSR